MAVFGLGRIARSGHGPGTIQETEIMNSLKLAGVASLALLLAGCGGNDEDDATPVATQTVARNNADDAPASFEICKACHSVQPGENGIGPTLNDIYDSTAGKVPGFEFSPALLQSGIKWDEASLDKWLTNPQAMVPGTKMSFGGMTDAAKRKEVIEYLKTL
jgi:cytochrome c